MRKSRQLAERAGKYSEGLQRFYKIDLLIPAASFRRLEELAKSKRTTPENIIKQILYKSVELEGTAEAPELEKVGLIPKEGRKGL